GSLRRKMGVTRARPPGATGRARPFMRNSLQTKDLNRRPGKSGLPFRGRTHATSAFDVMVGIQRVLEGTDWPVCSAVYCVGMPGSLNTVVQFLGRAMRFGFNHPNVIGEQVKIGYHYSIAAV